MNADTSRRIEDLNARLDRFLRLGEVTATYPERGTVRVRLADARAGGSGDAPLVSAELAVLHHRTGRDKSWWMPDVGEHVACLFLPFGREDGLVLGAIYSAADPVPVADQDKARLQFADGTVLEYDRAAHKLTGNVAGEIELTSSGNARLDVGGDLAAQVAGNATLRAGGDATLQALRITLDAAQILLKGALSAGGQGGGHGSETKDCDTDHTGDYHLQGTLQVTAIHAGSLIVDDPIQGTLVEGAP